MRFGKAECRERQHHDMQFIHFVSILEHPRPYGAPFIEYFAIRAYGEDFHAFLFLNFGIQIKELLRDLVPRMSELAAKDSLDSGPVRGRIKESFSSFGNI